MVSALHIDVGSEDQTQVTRCPLDKNPNLPSYLTSPLFQDLVALTQTTEWKSSHLLIQGRAVCVRVPSVSCLS